MEVIKRKATQDKKRRKTGTLDAVAQKTEEEPRRKIRGRAARTEREATERREETVTVAGVGGRGEGEGVGSRSRVVGVQGASSQSTASGNKQAAVKTEPSRS